VKETTEASDESSVFNVSADDINGIFSGSPQPINSIDTLS
jgi:hypothetical protein